VRRPADADAASAPMPPEPTSEQVSLLKAALLTGPDAVAAWETWRGSTTIEALDGDSQWLLPLLYHNLHAQGVPAALLVRCRNVYLHNWYKNSLTLRRTEPAIRDLARSDGPIVLLGGAAMAVRYYDAIGARPFGPLSVLAPGCAGSRRELASDAGATVEVKASLFGGDIDESVVRRASGSTWKTMRWLALDPADQLVDICARRYEWDRRSRLFWLADAALVVRRELGLDWERVSAVSAHMGLQAVVASLFAYLEDVIGLPIGTR